MPKLENANWKPINQIPEMMQNSFKVIQKKFKSLIYV